jgi:hypothetical protein
VSLRTVPRERVIVQNLVEALGSSGQTKWVADPSIKPVTVRCNAYPLTADEQSALGLINDVTARLFIHFGDWPGTQHSVITWDGSTWEQVGPAVQYRAGFATRHIQVTLRKVGTAHG